MNDKLQEVLTTLAAKLGTSIDHLWLILINQAKVEIFEDIMFIVFTIISIIITIKLHASFTKNNKYDSETYFVPMLFIGIACLFMFIISIVCVCSLPTLIMNPEYWALNKILDNLNNN